MPIFEGEFVIAGGRWRTSKINSWSDSLSAISVFDMSILNGLSGKLANLSLRFATQCSRFELLATALGQAFSISSPGVSLDFLECLPTAPGHDLVVGAAGFGQTSCGRFAKSV